MQVVWLAEWCDDVAHEGFVQMGVFSDPVLAMIALDEVMEEWATLRDWEYEPFNDQFTSRYNRNGEMIVSPYVVDEDPDWIRS